MRDDRYVMDGPKELVRYGIWSTCHGRALWRGRFLYAPLTAELIRYHVLAMNSLGWSVLFLVGFICLTCRDCMFFARVGGFIVVCSDSSLFLLGYQLV